VASIGRRPRKNHSKCFDIVRIYAHRHPLLKQLDEYYQARVIGISDENPFNAVKTSRGARLWLARLRVPRVRVIRQAVGEPVAKRSGENRTTPLCESHFRDPQSLPATGVFGRNAANFLKTCQILRYKLPVLVDLTFLRTVPKRPMLGASHASWVFSPFASCAAG
jgi:hypothetical protein